MIGEKPGWYLYPSSELKDTDYFLKKGKQGLF
jgi:hypothetical protein